MDSRRPEVSPLLAPAQIPPTLRDALATMEVLRRLGFTADDLYIRPQPAPGDVQVVVRAQELPEFTIGVGNLPCSMDAFPALWERAAASWAGFTDAQCREVLDTSRVEGALLELTAQLLARGYDLPGLDQAVRDFDRMRAQA